MTSRIVAIGTDLHRLGRFEQILKKNGLEGFKTRRLCERILNRAHEMPLFDSLRAKGDLRGCSTVMASAWCAKEAVYKALDGEDQQRFAMSRWWKVNDADGRPQIGGEYFEGEKGRGEQFLCSVSHDGDYMTCTVLRQRK